MGRMHCRQEIKLSDSTMGGGSSNIWKGGSMITERLGLANVWKYQKDEKTQKETSVSFNKKKMEYNYPIRSYQLLTVRDFRIKWR